MKIDDFREVAKHLEPDAWAGGDGTEAFIISAAISLKRIADKLDAFDLTPLGNQLLDIAYQAGLNFRGRS